MNDITRPLTAKQQQFCREYLIDLNATAAARRAGYSPRTAEQQGSRLLRKVEVQDAIQRAMAERAERNQLTADYVIERLKVEAESTGSGSSHGARVSALGLLGRHLGMFADRTGEDVEVQIMRIRIEQPPRTTDAEVVDRLAQAGPDDFDAGEGE